MCPLLVWPLLPMMHHSAAADTTKRESCLLFAKPILTDPPLLWIPSFFPLRVRLSFSDRLELSLHQDATICHCQRGRNPAAVSARIWGVFAYPACLSLICGVFKKCILGKEVCLACCTLRYKRGRLGRGGNKKSRRRGEWVSVCVWDSDLIPSLWMISSSEKHSASSHGGAAVRKETLYSCCDFYDTKSNSAVEFKFTCKEFPLSLPNNKKWLHVFKPFVPIIMGFIIRPWMCQKVVFWPDEDILFRDC